MHLLNSGSFFAAPRTRRLSSRVHFLACQTLGQEVTSENQKPDDEHEKLVEAACQGDEAALAKLFGIHQPRLKRLIKIRMDARLSGRVDPDDILQETFIDVARGIADYANFEDFPFFLWLRLMTVRRLSNTHRAHLGAKMRDAGREVSLHPRRGPSASTTSLAELFVARGTSVGRAIQRVEIRERIQNALNEMDPIDREVLTLRSLEELTNSETAQVLKLSKTAASNRYIRALGRLNEALSKSGRDAL